MMTRCSVEGCDGHYEQRLVIHTVRSKGAIVVVDGVPAEVCDICGDVLLSLDTVRRLETMTQRPTRAVASAPVLDFREAV